MIIIDSILSDVVDEWYGIHVAFHWSDDFDFDAALAKYGELALLREVAHKVTTSSQFQLFYSKHPTAVCDTSSVDDTPRQVRIPRFTMVKDYDDWCFDEKGGWIGASVR